jgi:hypothetical protein
VKRIFLATVLSLAYPAMSFSATGTSGSGAAPIATSTNCTAASKQSDVRGTQAQGAEPGAAVGGNLGVGKPEVQQAKEEAKAGPGKQAASGPLTPCG